MRGLEVMQLVLCGRTKHRLWKTSLFWWLVWGWKRNWEGVAGSKEKKYLDMNAEWSVIWS